MILLYGWGSKAKIMDYTYRTTCKICGQKNTMRVVKTYDYFSLFYIPIIQWNTKYYLDCPQCRNATLIGKDLFKQIKNGLRDDPNDGANTLPSVDPFESEFGRDQSPAAPAESNAETAVAEPVTETATEPETQPKREEKE